MKRSALNTTNLGMPRSRRAAWAAAQPGTADSKIRTTYSAKYSAAGAAERFMISLAAWAAAECMRKTSMRPSAGPT